MSEEVRRYGFFKCDSCRRRWESANVYCKKDSFEALYGQECSRCAEAGNDDVMVFPYRVERLKCPRCGSNAGCSCFEESSEAWCWSASVVFQMWNSRIRLQSRDSKMVINRLRQ
ncbi:protein ZAR1-like 1.L isoform X2 [Amphiura filiformis]|uniref:protein ZAR1-like 1.L isoform X2 n=1 Tax=Amphiura filiformis TaxID=82378 RepID=UPI003B21EA5B